MKQRTKKSLYGTTQKLRNDIPVNELEDVVKLSKNDKSPGPDGSPMNFTGSFWPELRYFQLNTATYHRNTGENLKNTTAGYHHMYSKRRQK